MPPSDPATETSGLRQLDAVIHERTRLGIVGALAANDRLSFVELKSILKTTDGNVSAHTRKLEDVGYIVAHKRFEGRQPRTEYELTEAGRKALERYVEQMERLLVTMRRR
jgi:DNA-binding MarR family transcriptional regulator